MADNSATGFVKNKLYPKPQRISKIQPSADHIQDKKDPFEDTIQTNQPNQNRNMMKHKTAFGFQEANFQLAIERKKQASNRYYKGQQVPFGVDREHFKVYGPGIYLFFQFMWKLSILFFILSLISLVPIIYNYTSGNRFSNSVSSTGVYISKISISNFYGNDPSKSSAQQINVTKTPKLINCISDLACSFIVMLFYFYWTAQSNKKTQELKRTIKMTNYYTIELNQFPQNATDHQIYNFFNKFGMVTEVAPVKNYSETIELSKQIYEYEMELKQLKMQTAQQQTDNTKQIQKIQKKIDKLYKLLAKQQLKVKQQTIKYYVSFSTPLQRANTLKRFSKVYRWCSCCTKVPQDYLLNGQKVKIKACHDQPGQILWENVHITWKTRWIRALLQGLLLLVFVAIGFFIISTLNIVTPQSSSSSIDTSSYTTTSILLQTNSLIVETWCLKDTTTATSTTALSNVCQKYITRYYVNIVITYSITIFVIVVKAILKKLVIFIAKFQRYKQQTEQSIDIVKNLVIVYIITTVVIGFLLQANLFNIKFKQVIPNLFNNQTLKENAALISDYSVLQNNWYVDIGYKIWLAWLIMAFTPHIYMPVYFYIMEYLREKWAKDQKLQKSMDAALLPSQFEIQDHYANIVMIFLIGLLFSGGMPSMLILAFCGIATRYVYFKFIFIRFCRVPKSIDQALNEKVISYFPWALFLHFCMSIWMYSVPTIFAFQQSVFSSWYKDANSSIMKLFSQILGMAISSYYYTATAVAIMVIVLIKQVIYDLIAAIFKTQSDKLEQIQKQDTSNDLVLNMRSQRGITRSYRIQNNPDYFQILSIKQKMKDRLAKGQLNDMQYCQK